MKKILHLLLHPLWLGSLALAVLALLVWWIGPLLAIGSWTPLVSSSARVGLIAVILVLVLVRQGLHFWRRRRASEQLNEGLLQPPAPSAASAPPHAEQQMLMERFGQAVAALRSLRWQSSGKKPGLRDWFAVTGGSYLYELPWYVFIGAPGAGKTTALIHSGLSFPLADQFGPAAIRGVGGTRNCDWWFTDEAVLLDTAGRYTTQDSHQEEDKAAWEGFLALLKKSRPRRPLNGVFLAVSVADLLTQAAPARAALAASIRARLLELDTALATRLPVYVLVTKSDLLHGFSEYFADLGKEQRAQVWGFTLTLQESSTAIAPLSEAFEREFALLNQRLNDGLIARMQQEMDAGRRAAIFGFPAQFSLLGPQLAELLREVFSGSRFAQPPWVRGVYFTSATQEGHPIDQVMGNLARNFGLERSLAPAVQGSGRSYFLTKLLRQVVFPEQHLASADQHGERRRHGLKLAGLGAMGLLAALLLVGWTMSGLRNYRYLQAVDTQVEPVRQALAALPAQLQDPMQLAPVLQGLRDIWQVPGQVEGLAPWAMGLGLYQGDKIEGAATLAHQRALHDAFLPQLAHRLEEQLRNARQDNLEYIYEALKSYLMLHDSAHFDADALKAWIVLDWERSLDRGVTQEQRHALELQLDALLAQGAIRSPLPRDDSLVQSTRALLASYPLEQRIFSRLRRQRLGAELPNFNLPTAAGPAAPLVFERASGKPLSEGVPGLYTYAGYHQSFQPAVAAVTTRLAQEEPWVLGQERTGERLRDVPALGALIERVRRLYLEQYVKEWETFLADVRLLRGNDLDKNIQLARTLSGSESPLASFLRAVVRETALTPPDKAGKDMVAKAAESVRSTRKSLEDMFGADTGRVQEPGQRIERIVDDRFEPLRRFVQAPTANQPAPLDDALKLFNDIYVYLTAVDAALKSRSAPPPADAVTRLKADAGRMPEPVRSMLETLSQAGAVQAQSAERSNLSQDLRPITEFCQRAVAGRYPLVASSSRDVLPEDFGQLFGPGGLMDDFFQKRLAPLVDTSSRPWKYKPVAGQGAVSATALAQFERAARIRDVFFRGGGRSPSMRLDFRAVEMDAGITQFILDVDGQLVKYAHGPVMPMAVQWPGPKNSNQVRVQISPPAAAGSSGLVADGPWALFRLLDRSQLEGAGTPEKFLVTFNVDNRRTRFEVTTNSVQHPLRLRELQEFACPDNL